MDKENKEIYLVAAIQGRWKRIRKLLYIVGMFRGFELGPAAEFLGVRRLTFQL